MVSPKRSTETPWFLKKRVIVPLISVGISVVSPLLPVWVTSILYILIDDL